MTEPAFYMKMLRTFVETGEEPDASLLLAEDALTRYLTETMHDVQLKAMVLNDDIAARIFMDTMAQFVSNNLQKAAYQRQRCHFDLQQLQAASEWSLIKRRDNWRALVTDLGKKYELEGFDSLFYTHEMQADNGYENDDLWQNMLNDWKDCIEQQLYKRKNDYLESRRQLQNMQLRNNLMNATRYIKEHEVSKDRFCQAWALMGGRWNVLEYERLQQVVNFQQRYPVLKKITDRMGRVADALGKQSIGHKMGTDEKIEHASQTDITGISMGRDLSSLLPFEWAQYTDADMENVFLQKYVTGRLQTFGYESHSANAARNLHKEPARPLGPMVVCVDTSGSMMGEPNQVTLSLMMRLCEMCENKRRDCYLIAFSVAAQPIDVLHDRAKLLQFFNQKAGGSTDARHMMTALFDLLRTNIRFIGADVLWVTDFRIPMPEQRYLTDIATIRQQGTRFYGLQLGMAENHWIDKFDEMYKIEEVKMAVR